MPLGILAMEGDKDIDIQQDHRPSMRSRSADDEDISTPGCKPSPQKVLKLRAEVRLA